MQLSDSILRHLISSSNDKFDGALEILDTITQLVADRLGAPLCATLYSRRGDSGYRLLSIEDTAGLETSSLPELERFVNSTAASDGFTDRYVSLAEESFVNQGSPEFARAAGLPEFYSYKFEPYEGDGALIVAFLDSDDCTSLVSASKVCRLAARQLSVVFKFVGLELNQRMFTAFFGVLLRLSALKYADMEISDTLSEFCQLGGRLQGVRNIELLGRSLDGARYREALRMIELDEGAGLDEDRLSEIFPDSVGGLGSAMTADAGYLVALQRSTEPAWLLMFHPNDASGFMDDELQLLRLFAAYASVALANHTLLLRHRRINNDLRTAQDRLVEAESLAARGDMASGLAHDFNNLLGAIIGKTQVMQATHTGSETVSRQLASIEDLARQGSERIRRLQEFAIQVRPATLDPLDLCALFDAYGKEDRKWRSLAQERGVSVRFIGLEEGVAMIEGQSEDITLMLDNIIRNAIEVTARSGVVEVRLAVEDGRATIQVTDSGPGIPSAIKNKIFNPFFSTKSNRGAGLGLSVAHGIAVRHGGSIRASSGAKAPGATFTTSFPLAGDMGAPGSKTEASAQIPALRIMVVDDDSQIREVVLDMLQLLDQDADGFEDGPGAIAAHEPGKYDLVITDLGMPNMSGIELMRILHESEPELPVSLVTGWGAQLDRNEMLGKGAFRVLSKPFSLKDIKNLVAGIPSKSV
ncbi:MAG: response regulator [Candidatus Zixiibacteriota bacterium]